MWRRTERIRSMDRPPQPTKATRIRSFAPCTLRLDAALSTPAVLAAKEHLAAGGQKLRVEHDAGCPGIQLCAQQSDLMDEVLLELFETALVDLGEDGPRGLAHE